MDRLETDREQFIKEYIGYKKFKTIATRAQKPDYLDRVRYGELEWERPEDMCTPPVRIPRKSVKSSCHTDSTDLKNVCSSL